VIIISVYAPVDEKLDETEIFYENLQKITNKCSKNDHIIIAGNLKARIGKLHIPKVSGSFREDYK
jgi:predicted transcriptional regulator